MTYAIDTGWFHNIHHVCQCNTNAGWCLCPDLYGAQCESWSFAQIWSLCWRPSLYSTEYQQLTNIFVMHRYKKEIRIRNKFCRKSKIHLIIFVRLGLRIFCANFEVNIGKNVWPVKLLFWLFHKIFHTLWPTGGAIVLEVVTWNLMTRISTLSLISQSQISQLFTIWFYG